jgi:hypothetical protein
LGVKQYWESLLLYRATSMSISGVHTQENAALFVEINKGDCSNRQ